MVIYTTWFLPPNAVAWTVFPFIFAHPLYFDEEILRHEQMHHKQQKHWALYGLGVGLIVWILLYLFALPVWWNPFRERWEREAFKAGERYTDDEINAVLSGAPYYLWSLTNNRKLR